MSRRLLDNYHLCFHKNRVYTCTCMRGFFLGGGGNGFWSCIPFIVFISGHRAKFHFCVIRSLIYCHSLRRHWQLINLFLSLSPTLTLTIRASVTHSCVSTSISAVLSVYMYIYSLYELR